MSARLVPFKRPMPILIVLSLAIIGAQGGAGAQTPVTVRIPAQTSAFQVQAGAVIAHCQLTQGPGQITYYTRANGTTYGTHTWTSSASCDKAMVYLWTLSHIVKLPKTQIYRGSPGVCGVDKLTIKPAAGCRYVQMSGGSYYCDPCNGTWELVSAFRMRFARGVGTWASNGASPCVVIDLAKPGRFGCTTVSKPLTVP
jgi:hypothetical protein